MRKSFIIHKDSLAVLDDLTDEQCGQLFRAIKAHQFGEQIELSAIAKVAFSPFASQFARDDEKYQNIVKRNQNNGLKGGRPRTQENPKEPTGLSGNPKEPRKADSVSKSDSKSKSKSKSDKDKTLDQSEIDRERMFDEFWNSGIRKVNKKKSKSLFNNLLKKQPCGWTFTNRITADIQERLNLNQLGFSEMHPTTYLNGERWTDEKVAHNAGHQSNTTQGPSFH